MNAQDFDGWTPLHAAGHWGQREACEVLLEHHCDMSIRNTCDQTALDIADSSVVSLLEEWRKKHDVNKNIDTSSQPPKPTALNNNNNNEQNTGSTVSPPKKSAAPQKRTDDDVTIVTSQLSQADDKSTSSATPYSISGMHTSAQTTFKTCLCYVATISTTTIFITKRGSPSSRSLPQTCSQLNSNKRDINKNGVYVCVCVYLRASPLPPPSRLSPNMKQKDELGKRTTAPIAKSRTDRCRIVSGDSKKPGSDVIDVDEAEDTLSELPSQSSSDGALHAEPISYPLGHHQLPPTETSEPVAASLSEASIPTTKATSASTNQFSNTFLLLTHSQQIIMNNSNKYNNNNYF